MSASSESPAHPAPAAEAAERAAASFGHAPVAGGMHPGCRRCEFVVANTTPLRPPHVGEIALHLADEAHDLWHRTETDLESIGLPPPFWAFAWAGGQGLARHILDHPQIVAGRTVLDLGCGSGLVAVAAALAGAARVVANDIDPYCRCAVALNSGLNGVPVEFDGTDLLATAARHGDRGRQKQPPAEGEPAGAPPWQVITAGDIFYDRELARAAWPWLSACRRAGATVLIGDPGRAYLPRGNLRACASYKVPVTRALEDSEVKHTRVWALSR